MAPVVYSTSRPKWQRIDKKQCEWYEDTSQKNHYIIALFFEFDNEYDQYYFAYCYPYSYTQLQKYIRSIELKNYPFLSHKVLCKTILNKNIDMLFITNPGSLEVKGFQKRTIVITSRIHPGETPASYMCEGLIDYLLSNDNNAKLLRKYFIFYIIPMLNVDGVSLGNYRSNVLGYDLNRCWENPSEYFHPSIYNVKKLLLQLHDDPKVILDFYIDLHAHSTGKNAFMYCNSMEKSSDQSREEIFPKKLSANSDIFSYRQTKFDNDPFKQGSGRRSVAQALTNVHCYTLEVSFYATVDISFFITIKLFLINICFW